MNSRLLRAVALFALLLPALFLAYQYLTLPERLNCNGTLVLQVSPDSQAASSRAAYQITVNADGSGHLFVNGRIRDAEADYRLNRTVFFHVRGSARDDGGYLMTITHVKRLPSDTTPTSVADRFLPLLSQQAETPLWLSTLDDGNMMVSGSAGVLLVCAPE